MKRYRVMSHDTEEWCKVWKKNWLLVPKMTLVSVSSGKSENLHFDELLLSIAYKVLGKKVRKNDLSWHWKKIQTLKKKWLFVWNMT